MKMNSRTLIIVVCFFFGLAIPTIAAEPKVLTLWEGSAPGAVGTEAKDVPKLILYPHEAEIAGPALVILPGGGYGGLAMDHEGHQIARWANELGMSAFICDYRHRGKGYGHPHPMLDAQRAIRTVRAKAQEWKIDPDRIGVIGFSAGGHLASTVLTHFDSGDSTSSDAVARVSCRPSFGILSYAVIDWEMPYTHRGSQKNLLGENPSPELIKSLSNALQVTKDTPPTFLWSTQDDTVVPVENSLRFYSAMATNKVPGELHVFPHGRHGLGLATSSPDVSQWTQLCQSWLKQIHILP